MRRGFTLLEVLLAIAITAVVAWLAAQALAPAMKGWRSWQKAQQAQTELLLAGLLLRRDLALLSPGAGQTPALVIENDSRAGREFDRLRLLAATDEFAELARVRWYVDERTGELVRESVGMMHARAAALEMRFGKVASFSVRARGEDGRWQDNWGALGAPRVLPELVEVKVKTGQAQMRWLAPVLVEREL